VILGVLTAACGGGETEAPAPPISTAAADALVPGGLARAASLMTVIRSAGEPCAGVTKTFRQGPRDGGEVWNAACSDGPNYAIVSTPQETTVMTCAQLENEIGERCFTTFEASETP
jgi:hypothetical protein